MKRWGLLGLALLLHPLEAQASPSLSGIEGGLDFPSSTVSQDGTMTVGIGHVSGAASYVIPPYSNRFYYATMTLLPGLEVNARFTEVLGLYDPTINLPNYVDRMISAKWQLPTPEGWPSLALGGVDLVSINELNDMVGLIPGSSRYGISAYGVMGQSFGPLRLELGYGSGKSYIQGPFGLARLELGWGFAAYGEYGNNRGNLGIGYAIRGLELKLGWLQGKEVGLASTYTFAL